MKIKKELLFTAVLFVSLALTLYYYLSIAILPAIFIASVFLYLVILTLTKIESKELLLIFEIYLFFSCLLLIYQAKFWNLPLSGNDWEGYDRHALNIIKNSDVAMDYFMGNQNLFPKIVAIVYKYFGFNNKVIIFLIYFCNLITLNFLMETAKKLQFSTRAKSAMFIFYCCMPIQVIFSMSYLREVPIQMCTAIFFYYLVLYLNEAGQKKYLIFLKMVLFATIATLFHSGMISLLFLSILFVILYDNNKFSLHPVRVLFLVATFLICLNLPILDPFLTKFGDLTPENIFEQSSYSAGNTTYVTTEINGFKDMFLQLPYRVIMFWFAPMIWQVKNLSSGIAFALTSLPQILFTYIFVKVWQKRTTFNLKDRNILFICVALICLTLVLFSFGTNNYGSAIRHRMKIWPVCTIIVGYYFSLKTNDRGTTWKLD